MGISVKFLEMGSRDRIRHRRRPQNRKNLGQVIDGNRLQQIPTRNLLIIVMLIVDISARVAFPQLARGLFDATQFLDERAEILQSSAFAYATIVVSSLVGEILTSRSRLLKIN